jgi:hypothetical protein
LKKKPVVNHLQTLSKLGTSYGVQKALETGNLKAVEKYAEI